MINIILKKLKKNSSSEEKKIKKSGLRLASKFEKNNNTSNSKLKLDLGSGDQKRPGFIGIDLNPKADLQWDLRWGLPFGDNSVDEIRSDHFFEHLELTKVVELLKECYRVLKKGGKLDFSVPHIDPYIDAYLKRDFEFLQEKIFDTPKTEISIYNTCFDKISWLLYRSGEHKSCFDKESIIDKVKLAGFKNIKTREFDPKIDIQQRYSSIYIVAIK